MTVGEMTPVREGHGKHDVAGLEHGPIDRLIGRGAAVRLDVRMFGAEQSLRPLDSKRLHVVNDVAPAIVPSAGIALGILVGEHAAHGLQHRQRGEVLGGDEFDIALLAGELALDHAAQKQDRPAQRERSA